MERGEMLGRDDGEVADDDIVTSLCGGAIKKAPLTMHVPRLLHLF